MTGMYAWGATVPLCCMHSPLSSTRGRDDTRRFRALRRNSLLYSQNLIVEAIGHFMDHRYYDFDAAIRIEPPTR